MSRVRADRSRAFALLAAAAQTLAGSADTGALYAAVEAALRELVGYRLFTILRATPARDGLQRVHSSDLVAYPPQGVKQVTGDPWLERLLDDPRPGLSPDAQAVMRHFPDAQAIFALGCASVLNIPVSLHGRVLGTMNLLHEAHWFDPDDAGVCQPFALLLGAAWASADASSQSTSPAPSPAGVLS